MTELGLGVMLNMLCAQRVDLSKYRGKKITKAEIEHNDDEAPDELVIKFEDGSQISIYDGGQSCCEARYMTCDDNPSDLVGGEFIDVQVRNCTETNEDYDVHEMCFVEVKTDKASIVLTAHNKHNGYYGGFALTIKEEPHQ